MTLKNKPFEKIVGKGENAGQIKLIAFLTKQQQKKKVK